MTNELDRPITILFFDDPAEIENAETMPESVVFETVEAIRVRFRLTNVTGLAAEIRSERIDDVVHACLMPSPDLAREVRLMVSDDRECLRSAYLSEEYAVFEHRHAWR